MKEIVWGLVGCGDVTEKKSGPPLYRCRNSRLKAVYNRSWSKALDWTVRHGHGLAYQSAEELFSDPDINAVYIATPPETHYAYAKMSLEAGKIPLIEKPMAQGYNACLELIELARSKRLSLFVNYYRRSLEKIQAIKRCLDAGEIGQALTVEIRHFVRPSEAELSGKTLPWRLRSDSGGGKALDTQVHVLDYLSYLFGPILDVKGTESNLGAYYDVADTTVLSFYFGSHVMASATWCYVAGRQLDEVCITGTRGSMTFSGTGLNDLNVNGIDYCFDSPESVAEPYIQSVIDELVDGKKGPSDIDCAANICRVFEQIDKLDLVSLVKGSEEKFS